MALVVVVRVVLGAESPEVVVVLGAFCVAIVCVMRRTCCVAGLVNLAKSYLGVQAVTAAGSINGSRLDDGLLKGASCVQ